MEKIDLNSFVSQLSWRYATKKFDAAIVLHEDIINKLKQALILTPSSFGLQPWKFLLIQDKEVRAKLKEAAWNQTQVTDASHLFVLCAKTSVTSIDVEHLIATLSSERGIEPVSLAQYKQMMLGFLGVMTPIQIESWTANQVYLALGVLLSACAVSEIDACPMEGFNREQVDNILGLSAQGYTAKVLCAVGKRASDDWLAPLKKVRYTEDALIQIV